MFADLSRVVIEGSRGLGRMLAVVQVPDDWYNDTNHVRNEQQKLESLQLINGCVAVIAIISAGAFCQLVLQILQVRTNFVYN